MGHDAKYQQWKREQARQEADKLSQMALAPREEEPEGEPRADVSDALWCMECGYRRGTSSGQTRTKCPHGHGELVRARLLTLEQFSKIVPRPAPAANTEGLRAERAEADIEKLKMDAEHLQYERDEAREKLAAEPDPRLREELALYREEYEARHSYGHKQGITSPQAKRYQEAKRKLIVFRALARTPPQKGENRE